MKSKIYAVADAITELRVIVKNGVLSHPTSNDVTNGGRYVKLGYSLVDLAWNCALRNTWGHLSWFLAAVGALIAALSVENVTVACL